MSVPRFEKTKFSFLSTAAIFFAITFSAEGQGLLREYWSDVTGSTVASLTGNSNYPNNPTSRGTITSFEGPSALGDNYGSRFRGYVVPPTTGSYTFWLASDDNAELYISTSADPSAKTLIASVSDWTNSREWTKYSSQQSTARTLTAGQRYYVEVLHKEGTGGDNVAVGWQGPGITGEAERPIPGTRLIPYEIFYQINAGTTSAAAPFTADQFVSGGTSRTVTNTIDMSGVTDPAPQAVYQSERWGASTYTFPGLTASANYKVRLHFAELYQTTTGSRRFNVTINGTAVLSNFDIYATAGARYKAVVREFQATANSSGQIVIAFTNVTDNATIEGIEVLPNSATNNAPTVATAAAASPNPVTATTTSLSALGADDLGEANLTYTWATTGTPPASVSFSANGTNAAKSVTATFTRAGSYTLQATIRDQGNLTATSTVNITVNQTLTGVAVSPATTTINTGATQQYTATGTDQFGIALTTQPTWNWTTNGGGTINSSGLFTATLPGSFTITATNAGGSITNNAVITINAAPVITTQPTSQTVAPGSSVTFNVAATGTPVPTYQWKKNGTNISGQTGSSYTIDAVQASDAGLYTVTATNIAGYANSGEATLTVSAAPVITVQPVSQLIVAGSPVTFSVTASGDPAPTYQWSKGLSIIPGATNANYTISEVQISDEGNYTVTVTNGLGSATSIAATLTVTVAPVITTQPSSQRVNLGGSVTFLVEATGTPTPTYQWRKGGANIPSATNASYTINSIQASDAGSYTVMVSNAAGNVPSSTAMLTINSAPTVATAASGAPDPVYGNSTQLSVLGADVDDGEPNLTYTWTTTGTPPGNVTYSGDNGTNSAKLCVATFTKAGTYNFQVTIRDQGDLSITSNTSVYVRQTLTKVSVIPQTAFVNVSETQQFAATAIDQFDEPLVTQPTNWTWTISSGEGMVSNSGLYAAPGSSGGPYTLTATSGSKSGTADVTVTTTEIAYAYPNVCGADQNMKVDGQIKCKSLLIYNWLLSQKGTIARVPDYVFEEGYDLKSLKDVKEYIKENGHLPEVPGAKELESSGVDMVQLNFILLKKIEELTLHLIRQDEKIEALEKAK